MEVEGGRIFTVEGEEEEEDAEVTGWKLKIKLPVGNKSLLNKNENS